ncbi:10961_t:CDS:2 [Acaulospora colombiana]|uniref:10961_t:CDS:1 n=1 Tax=Acaulospora colombiana TaxID=27376 RepID=A0ACA9M0M5_9GLOM|nr:10961_t:CDS:2 [Acaulospora colombiana]
MNNYLQGIDKRKEWKNFYEHSNPKHPEDIVKNVLIEQIDIICPGFKYLIDFDWEAERGYSDKGKGDLIFGSDYGEVEELLKFLGIILDVRLKSKLIDIENWLLEDLALKLK